MPSPVRRNPHSLTSAAVIMPAILSGAEWSFAQPSTGSTPGIGAEPTRLKQVADGFAGRHDFFTSHDLVTLIWGVVLVAAVIALTLIAYQWQRTDAIRFGAEYRRLARDLKVSLLHLWLLDRIARRSGMQNAMGLLISRGTFDHWTTRYFEQQQADSLRARLMRNQIAKLRRFLFTDS